MLYQILPYIIFLRLIHFAYEVKALYVARGITCIAGNEGSNNIGQKNMLE